MSEEKVFGSVPGNRPGEEIQVRRSEFKGRTYVSIRTWYPSAEGNLLPGKGISIELDKARKLVPTIIEACRPEEAI
jgi:Transcriptional Coactivator p15 (PC4)